MSRRFRKAVFGVVAQLAACSLLLGLFAPVAFASPAAGGPPAPHMYGYAKGPAQRTGSAAGRAHLVPASATRATGAGGLAGHRAPRLNAKLPPTGTRAPVWVPAKAMPKGHLIAGAVRGSALSGTDNATYSVAPAFDTAPMADQNGYIAVTLTNTGTSTWGSGYALGTQVFSGSTLVSTGANVAIGAAVAPNGVTAVESITPHEVPGSYTICWDMVNPAGTYFSAEGGNEDCAAYTIQQYPAQVNEQEPLPGADVDSLTPNLSATATVPGGYPASPQFTFAFQILNGPNPATATVLQSSGWVAGNASTWSPTTDLTWGTTYYWRTAVTDAATPPSLTSATWTTPVSFTVGNAQPGVSGQFGSVFQADDGDPVMTSDLGGTDFSGSGKTVDPRTGNVSLSVTDASVETAGPQLSIERTYNSLDPRTSQALGAGWSSELDMSLAPDSDGSGALILTLADGEQVRFAKNAAGGYAPPQAFYASVTPAPGGGFTVTDQAGATWAFTQASGPDWLLSKISDEAGMSETFGYVSGVLATITNSVSGRALHLTWSTPAGATYQHVASVATDPVTAGQPATALTWTYSYTGDLLAAMCPPGTATACTRYGYVTNGSHAATAIRNTNPDAYYRLDDPSGTTAAVNQMPVDELTTLDPPAAEVATTPGVAGPAPGVTATGFNGSSSWIPLDGVWCGGNAENTCEQISDTGRVLSGDGNSNANTTLNTLAISVWFKTSSASSVLAGVSGVAPGQTACEQVNSSSQCIKEADSVPLLWIDSAGHLDGLNAVTTTSVNTSETGAMASSVIVDNGAWHQAVVIPGRALYLDGKQIATGSGQTLTLPAPANTALGDMVFLGAGLNNSCAGCNPPLWQYFSGSMADAAVWQNQVPGPDAVAAQFAAETTPAAELSSITTPAGRTELAASYDTANDRVTSLTDAKGGTWTYGGAVSTSTAGAYDSAVMADAPEDFWPLSDASGTQATNLIGSASTSASPRPPATYSNVTLGQAGLMPDQTAAGFTSSSSKVAVASADFNTPGPVSAEVWFKTSTIGQDVLLTGASGAVGGDPLVIQVSSGCLQAKLADAPFTVAKDPGCGSTSNFVDDGAWHQAVATLGPPSAPSGGKVTQTITLYQDGRQIGSVVASTSSSSASGALTDIGSDLGSLADVSVYPSTLTANQVSGHFAALANQQDANFAGSGLTLPAFNTQTITVTNPLGGKGHYVYASGALVEQISPAGGITRYGYDDAMRADTITDPDGNTTYTAHDARNNVTSTTTCATVNNCQTVYTSYFENLPNPLDPRNDKPTDERDARSSSPSDPAYDKVTAYLADGQVASESTPPTAACPAGCRTTYTYTAGSEPAVGGGTEPPALVASMTAPGGGVTSYLYTSAGEVAQVTSPLGMVTKYTYDTLGRELSETQISDSFPGGLTTSLAYDSQDRLVSETDPPVTDRVTGAVHTKVTSYTYDADGNVLTTTISDSTGGDPSRVTTDTFDGSGNLSSEKDALGNVTGYTYDALGDKLTETNPAGTITAYGYDTSGDLLTTTLQGYTGNPSSPVPAQNLVEESRAYDPAGRIASVTSMTGTTIHYTYYGNDQTASSYVTCSGCTGQQDVHTYGYDPAGNEISQTAPGGLTVNTSYDADNQVTSQVVDPAGVDRGTTLSYDSDGNVVSQSVTGGGATQTETATYNVLDQELSQTVDNTGGNLTTTYKRDQRGLVIAETDPAGNTTTFANDETGKPVVETLPAVPAQNGTGSAPVTASPITTTGYNTFGEQAEVSDPNGNVTRYGYDLDGEQVSVTDPSYTPPGSSGPVNGTSTTVYDSLGRVTSQTDPDGNVTQYTYDQLGDQASQTDPGGGVWTYTYDQAGEQLSETDPTGAQTQSTYDPLGNLLTTTDLVRQNTSAAYTTTYGYDAAGNRISQTSPTGVKSTAVYDAVGELTSSTDGAGNTTKYGYDLDGHLLKQTLPDGTALTAAYDQAGRQTSMSDLSTTGSVLRGASLGYDADSNVVSSTDLRGNTSTFTYDATGAMLTAVQPVASGQSVGVSYGYDLDGHRTALTDGNGNTTYSTYNSLGLPETITEPQTAQYATAATSQTTDSYDGDGNLVTQDQPGGVQLTSVYDPNGQVTSESGTGASAPTANRSFSYDGAGRLLTAATTAAGTQGMFGYQPATSESFTWDDRGLLLSAAGTAGTTTYTYNGAGQEASVSDAAGTSSYTYDSAGRLATDADAASGTTGTYSYNSLNQVSKIGYGSGNNTQSFGYDSLHRLTSDSVATSSGGAVASIGYGYDNNDNVTSVTTTGLDTPSGTGSVTSRFGYDEANRLTSWTATPSGGTAVTKTYGYDNNGNLVNNNGVTQTYDARNELTSDGNGNSYTYTANGDLATQASPGNTSYSFSSDAYGQQITDGFSSFGWDALNRVVSAGEAFNSSYGVALTYDGLSLQVASDPSATYSRDPAGQLVGVNSVAGGKTLALVDGHDDLSGTFAAAGTSMTSSTTWDPWGQALASTGPAVQVGYQGQWTDPVTQQVSMGSRFYRPPWGGFVNSDTYTGAEGGPAVTDDLHAYANDNPVTLTDVSGHSPSSKSGSGGISMGQVSAAYARSAGAERRSLAARAEAGLLKGESLAAAGLAWGAKHLADVANAAAHKAEQAAALAAQLAASAFAKAAAALQQAKYWQDQADAAWESARQHLDASHGWNPISDAANAYDALKEGALATIDEGKAGWYGAKYLFWEGVGHGAQFAEEAAKRTAAWFTARAKGLSAEAARYSAEAASLSHRASQEWAYAASQQALARQYWDEANQLSKAYAAQQARKAWAATKRLVKNAVKAVAKVVKRVAKTVAHAAVSAAHWVAKHSKVIAQVGMAVAAVALTVVNVAQLGLDPVTDAAEAADVGALATDVAATTAEEGAAGAEDVGESAAESCGLSFSASTKVLLANGTSVPISSLKVGQKVLAANPKTGKEQPEIVEAVLINHDKDLYDLQIRSGNQKAVIHTTSNHPFWDASSDRWVKAGALRYGSHLRTATGGTATVVRGWAPRVTSGWMWDLTVRTDHDFYVEAGSADALVHNCTDSRIISSSQSVEQNQASINARPSGTGFNAIYDPESGSFEARLSEGDDALVVRNGGHTVINDESFGSSGKTVAFTIITRDEGLDLTWKSTGINFRHFEEMEAPQMYRGPIGSLVEAATGMTVGGG